MTEGLTGPRPNRLRGPCAGLVQGRRRCREGQERRLGAVGHFFSGLGGHFGGRWRAFDGLLKKQVGQGPHAHTSGPIARVNWVSSPKGPLIGSTLLRASLWGATAGAWRETMFNTSTPLDDVVMAPTVLRLPSSFYQKMFDFASRAGVLFVVFGRVRVILRLFLPVDFYLNIFSFSIFISAKFLFFFSLHIFSFICPIGINSSYCFPFLPA